MSTEQQRVGVVYPPAPAVAMRDKDAREYALERLREYILALVFERTGEQEGQSESFRLSPDNVHTYQPDDVTELGFPALGFLPTRGVSEPYGLGPPVLQDETVDRYAPGTALLLLGDYTEELVLEVVATKQATRRAIVAGLKEALRVGEDTYALKLTLPAYFDQVAQFTLGDVEYLDDPGVVQNRRRAHVHVWLQVTEVALVNVRRLQSSVEVQVVGPGEALPELVQVKVD